MRVSSANIVSLEWRRDTTGSISTFIAKTLPSFARDEEMGVEQHTDSVDIEASDESSASEMGHTSRN